MPQKPKPLILIVEDEKEVANSISEFLEGHGMYTQIYNSGQNLIRFLERNFANLMLLDVNLPDRTGFSILEEIRRAGHTIPVIFLTANDSENLKVRGLEMGGDDYITKPFSLNELVARIHAVLRRSETAADNHVTNNATVTREPFKFCEAVVNPVRLEVEFPDGEIEKIGRKELGILTFLFDNKGTVLTRRSLIHSVWGVHADIRSRSLDQYIVKIRDLFTRHNCSMESFRTIHGVGYIYDPDN